MNGALISAHQKNYWMNSKLSSNLIIRCQPLILFSKEYTFYVDTDISYTFETDYDYVAIGYKYSFDPDTGSESGINVLMTCTDGSNQAVSSENTDNETVKLNPMLSTVSRTQAYMTVNNLQNRLNILASAIGASPTQNTDLSNSLSENDDITYRQGDLRELFNKLSFNSHDLILAADGDTTGMPDQQRLELENRDFTIWGQANQSNIDNDIADGAYSGHVWGYNLGADYRYNDRLTAGVSIGYSETDLITSFNDGTYDEKAWSLTPYTFYRFSSQLSLMAMAGYSQGSIDQSRNNDAVTSDTNSTSWFADILAEGKFTALANEALELKPRLGFLFVHKKTDGYRESDGSLVESIVSNTRQLKPGIEIAYRTTSGDVTVQPFLKTDYLYDFTDETNSDSGAFNIGGGVRVSSDEKGVSGLIEGSSIVGRDDYNEYTISALVSYEFNIKNDNHQNIGIASPYLRSDISHDGKQIFGTGFDFNTLDDHLTYKFSLTHSPSFDHYEENSAIQLNIDFKF